MTPTDVETLRALAAQWHAEANVLQMEMRERTARDNATIHAMRTRAWELEAALDKLTKEGT